MKEERGKFKRYWKREGYSKDNGGERDIKQRMEERMVRRGRRDK